jgi:heme A synthase
LAILSLGASGAVTALGDTLFPSSSLAEGIRQDFSPTAHFLTRMRVFHPGIAVGAGVYLFLATLWVRRQVREPRLEAFTNGLFGLYVLQILLGITNVALLAPVWMQIVHLLVSNLVWITYVLMGTVVFSSALPVTAAQGTPRLGDHKIHDRVDQTEKVG